jgi:hypothetical protein
MTRGWFKFETLDDEKFGLGTAEEACEYAAILNDRCDGELCKSQALSRVQSFGLIVLVTDNTFVISDVPADKFFAIHGPFVQLSQLPVADAAVARRAAAPRQCRAGATARADHRRSLSENAARLGRIA